MIRKLAAHVLQDKRSARRSPLCAAGEVAMEVLLPLTMAQLLTQGIEPGNMSATVKYGLLMMLLALVDEKKQEVWLQALKEGV